MNGSRDSWQWMLRKAAGTSLLCLPLICIAGQVEGPRAGAPNATVVQDPEGAKSPTPALSASQDAASKPPDVTNTQIPDEPPKPRNYAVAAAVADGVSTKLALSAGAVEANAVAGALPLVALTGAKVALALYADTLPENEKRLVIKTSSSVWGGAAVNNVLLLMATPPPIPIAAGILMGILVWHKTGREYEDQDRQLAARQAAKLAATPASTEPAPGVAP